jgi:hypothetical protein
MAPSRPSSTILEELLVIVLHEEDSSAMNHSLILLG